MSTAAPDVPVCMPISLPADRLVNAAKLAVQANPANAPMLALAAPGMPLLEPSHLAALTGTFWAAGTTLTVRFLDGPTAGERAAILSHLRALSEFANIDWEETSGRAMIRIARTPGRGYSSYVGTQNLSIPEPMPTMTLDSFTLAWPEGERRRVIRHEGLHAIGFVHEHQRRAIVELLDPQGCYDYYGDPPNLWPKRMVDAQVLTWTPDEKLWYLDPAEPHSLACYQFPGRCTKSRQPIPGGTDLTDRDKATLAKAYPGRGPVAPPPLGRQRLEFGVEVEDSISRPGEVDEFDAEAPGGFIRATTTPILQIGVFSGDGRRLIDQGTGAVRVSVPQGPVRIKVKHTYARGTAAYRVGCVAG